MNFPNAHFPRMTSQESMSGSVGGSNLTVQERISQLMGPILGRQLNERTATEAQLLLDRFYTQLQVEGIHPLTEQGDSVLRFVFYWSRNLPNEVGIVWAWREDQLLNPLEAKSQAYQASLKGEGDFH